LRASRRNNSPTAAFAAMEQFLKTDRYDMQVPKTDHFAMQTKLGKELRTRHDLGQSLPPLLLALLMRLDEQQPEHRAPDTV
jgi:hypothetical protein